jgi:hypothetical protein
MTQANVWVTRWQFASPGFNVSESEQSRIYKMFSQFSAREIIMSEHFLVTNVFNRLTGLHGNWYKHRFPEV